MTDLIVDQLLASALVFGAVLVVAAVCLDVSAETGPERLRPIPFLALGLGLVVLALLGLGLDALIF